MRQLLIHLSDIHFKGNKDLIMQRVDQIINSINPLMIQVTEIVILVSGDIAFSGKDEEYNIALSFFESLKNGINTQYNVEANVFIAPGNHDRNFDYKNENANLRELTLQGIQSNESSIDDGIINLMTEIQSNFFDFQEILCPKPENTTANRIFNKYKISFSNNKSIILYLYNSAWTSIKKEISGRLLFPIDYIDKNLFKDKSDLTISVIHHPFNWNAPQNSRNLINHLKSTSDFILTGHEHNFSKYLNDNFEGNYTEFIESGALQDDSKSSYNVIVLDLENRKHLLSHFEFDNDIYRQKNIEDKWNDIKRDNNLEKELFSINQNTINLITNPGASFSNKSKEVLTLRDIYVFPDLKKINYTSKTNNTFSKFINSKTILNFTTSEFKVVFTGEERSGKTAMCKTIFKIANDEKFFPLYIKGTDIKTSSIDDFNKVVLKAFKNQYIGDLELFKQTDNSKKIVIIDDFDKSSLKSAYRNNFLKNISTVYTKIIITGTDLVLLLDFISDNKDSVKEIRNFNHFEMIQFGPKLRNRIIKKWLNININDENLVLEEKIYRELDYLTQYIDVVIGKNFVPSYPFFILTLLQAYEAGKQHDLSASQYSSYYDLLINLSLHKIDKKEEVITFYDNLLIEFCYFLFIKKYREVSVDKFNDFYEIFKKDFDIDNHLGSQTIVENLTKVNILKRENEQISVYYNFIFYYYVARYLRDSLHSNDTTKLDVENLVENIHVEQSANILMFLTYLSNDPLIYQLLKSKAKSILSDYSIAKLENDIKEINNLSEEIPSLILETKSIEQARKEKLEIQNSKELDERYHDETETTNDLDEEIGDELDLVSQLNSAFKTIEITGQISRKYYAKIKADEKLELVQEVFELGFRTMHLFLSIIANNKDAFIQEIESRIEEDKDNEEINKEIRQFLFYISFMIGNGIIKKISTSLGSTDLSKTFARIEKSLPYVSTLLVNNSIKLEFNKGINIDDIAELKDKIKDNILANTILKQQVIDYLYTFPVNTKTRNSICSLLGIPIKSQIIIDKTSRIKKTNAKHN